MDPQPGAGPRNSGYDRTGRVFILVCLVAVLAIGWRIFRPFLGAIATAAILDVVFYPVYARLRRRFGDRKGPAAGVTVLLVVVCVILPFLAMLIVFTRQALQFYDFVSAKAQDGTLDQVFKLHDWDALQAWLAQHAPWLDTRALNLKSILVGAFEKISSVGVGIGSSLVANVLGTIVSFAVTLFSLFFFLIDGSRFARWLSALSPLTEEHERLLADTFIGFTKSSVLGSGLIAIAQGLLGGIAFWGVGLRGVLWGFVMTFMSLVPLVGTAAVWIPAGLVLLVLGKVGSAIFLFVYGTLVISGADNVIRLLVVKGPRRMHPLLLFFAILGGLKYIGPLGIVLGPVVLAMILTFLEFYRAEFIRVSTAPPAAGDGG